MKDNGASLRMGILRQAADQQIVKPMQTHGWDAHIISEVMPGEYIIIEGRRLGVRRSVALLYSSATDNAYYRTLDATVDAIFTNGALYMIESFAQGISKPVKPVDEFFSTLVEWNKALGPQAAIRPPHAPKVILRLTAEKPIDAIWARLERLASVRLAAKIVERRWNREETLQPKTLKAKAEGVAYSVRSGVEYFRRSDGESLSRRIVSLYYGVIALASAEMLASPSGPSDLDEVEGFTKAGHGLYALTSAGDELGTLKVGVLSRGFYPNWVNFLGGDVSGYPKQKAGSDSDLARLDATTHSTMAGLFSSIPELGDLFLEIFNQEPSWVIPHSDMDANGALSGFRAAREAGATYIRLLDASGRVSQARLESAGWPLAEITPVQDEDGQSTFRARVDHVGYSTWHGAVPIHYSPFLASGALILPGLAGAEAYRTNALVVLYALSIAVRYLPSIWRRVEGGDSDQYLILVRTAIEIFERVLPEAFLESITGEHIVARQPGSFT